MYLEVKKSGRQVRFFIIDVAKSNYLMSKGRGSQRAKLMY
jgi:hypothetical protein